MTAGPPVPIADVWSICCTALAGRAWAQARAVLEEGARHNLAPGSRNFNLPTVVVFFLHPERQKRFSWKRRSDARAPAWELEYRERDRPTLIRHGDGRSVFSRGRVWMDAASGAVLRTDLVLELDTFAYELTTRFERVAAMDSCCPCSSRNATRRQGRS